jgi:phage shock protein C
MSPARLTRSETDRVIGGVCGGLAAYLGINVNLVRLAFVLLTFASGMGFVLYLLLLLIMPSESDSVTDSNWQKNLDDLGESLSSGVEKARQDPSGRNIIAVFFIGLGLYFLLTQLGLFSGGYFFPLLLIVLGIILVVQRSRR